MGTIKQLCLHALAICWFVAIYAPTVSAQSSIYDPRYNSDLDTNVGVLGLMAHSLSCGGAEKTLLIQDVVPWAAAANQDPNGAIVNELKHVGKHFCAIESYELDNTDLSQFEEIIIASAQTQEFYDNLFPTGVFHAGLTNWVDQGGVLLALMTDSASGPGAGGNWDGDIFIGGVEHITSFRNGSRIHLLEYNTTGQSPTQMRHPITRGKFGYSNGGRIEDSGPFNDLDDWGSSSHGYFINLPFNVRVVLTQRDVTGDGEREPVLVEYPYGSGRVIAALTTTEWRYVGGFGGVPQNTKLLANLIGFQTALTSFRRPMDIWGTITQEFGEDWAGTTKTTKNCDAQSPRPFQHAGMDINPGSKKQPVYAAAAGDVVACGKDKKWGEYMVLSHFIAFADVTTVYWHVEREKHLCPGDVPRSPVGARVKKGDKIAKVAEITSRGRDISHLHFGVRVAGYGPNVSNKGALPPAGTDGCKSSGGVALPAFPAGFIDPEIVLLDP